MKYISKSHTTLLKEKGNRMTWNHMSRINDAMSSASY